MNNKINLDDVIKQFKGKGGDPEAESILNDSNSDKKEGYVSFWSNKSDAAKVIERCKNSIINCEVIGDGVQLTIDRKAFRGLVYCFRRR